MFGLRATISALMVVAVLAPATGFAQSRTAAEDAQGDQTYPQILAQTGGVIVDAELTRYVDQLGQKLASYSSQADAQWTFSILDTPIVNAFATPGGYIYLTRGLLALANDEAELAAVIGHEIGHVTAHHGAQRDSTGNRAGIGVLLGAVIGGLANGREGLKDGIQMGAKLAMGYVAQNSQTQEYEADKLGIRLIAAAGYDPNAQADFLDHLLASTELEAKLRGRQYNPNQVSFFASHPATADRVRAAIREARKQGLDVDTNAPRNEQAYLAAISGMVFGDSSAQGFVRARSFSHPEMRFTFTVPKGFVITNSAQAVLAEGPNRATFKLDGGRDDGQNLRRFINRTWLPGLANDVRIGQPGEVQAITVNGLEAATVSVPARIRRGEIIVQLTAIRFEGQIIRLTGVSAIAEHATAEALADAVYSFRALSAGEAAALRPYTLETYQVQAGDTAAFLAASFPFSEYREGYFRVLNGYDLSEEPQPGDLVKLVAE